MKPMDNINRTSPQVLNCLNTISVALQKGEKRDFVVFSLSDSDINCLLQIIPENCISVSDSYGKVPYGLHYCKIDLIKLKKIHEKKLPKSTTTSPKQEKDEEENER